MIKFLLVIAVVFVVLSLMRGSREVRRSHQETRARPAPPPPKEMVECPVCHVHLPRSDALPGPDGQLYCCAEHRQRADRA